MNAEQDGREKARRFLEDNLGAIIADDPERRYAVARAYEYIDTMDVMPTRHVTVNAVKISMHPAQFDRFLSILSFIVEAERRDTLGYRTAQEAAANEILTRDVYQRKLHDQHPSIREAYDRYMMAIRLCT